MKLHSILSKRHSFKFFFQVLLVLLILITAISLFVSNATRDFIKNQNIQQLTSSIEIYANGLNDEMRSVERFLYSTITHDEGLEELNEPQSYMDYEQTVRKVQTTFNDYEYQHETHMSFLVATEGTHHFLSASTLYIPYQDYLYLKNNINSFRNNTDDRKWQPIIINDTEYLIKVVHYKEKTIMAVISADDILTPLRKLNIGKNGQISLKKPKNLSPSTHLIEADSERTQLPFDIYVAVDYTDVFKSIVLFEVFIATVPILIAIASLVLIIFIRNRMLNPITRLTERLSRIDETTSIYDITSSEGILEIDTANDKLSQVLFDMQELKIREYHAQLELKKVELNYLKSQIRPHFYLNMLSMIHSMLQTENYKEIEELTILTSDYLRYLFMVDQDFSPLEKEIQHIKDYLEIQRIRYGNHIDFALTFDERLHNALVPSLLLQTFVENTIKHGFSFQDGIVIDLSLQKRIVDEKPYIGICVKDNGPGFSREILSKLKNMESLISEDGHHIGITNAIERLNLLYSNDYTITFENNDTSGARIDVLVPYKELKGDSNEYTTR
ncbi:sensor histidine kinase [Granulicatella adiacens]|uniref:sensor histidine kinase n=1 Tax=Granulicatella adiacens TaxID=46124 RepID=UPI001C3D850D|nr:histidine kinase [Granulicatella adiacens]